MNEIAKIQSTEVPAVLQEFGNEGVSDIKASGNLQRLKFIQSMRQGEYREFSEGDIVLTPDMIQLFENRDPEAKPLGFVPIFHFELYSLWEPLKANAELPVIEATCDPTHEVAKRAKDRNRWFEPHPEHPEGSEDWEKWQRRYVASLKYVVILDGVPFPVLLSFEKGSYKYGQKFGNRIKMRKQAIYCQRYTLAPKEVENKNQEAWFVPDCQIDAERPWETDLELLRNYQELYRGFKTAYDENTLGVEVSKGETYSDEDAAEANGTPETSDTL